MFLSKKMKTHNRGEKSYKPLKAVIVKAIEFTIIMT